MKITGKNAVIETLKVSPERVHKVYIPNNQRDNRIQEIKRLCQKHRIPFLFVSQKQYSSVTLIQDEVSHQSGEVLLDKFINDKSDRILLVFDHVFDPHNLGAVIRSFVAFGGKRLVLMKRRSSPITETVYQSSAGSLEKVEIGLVNNIARFLDKAKGEGIQVYGTVPRGGVSLSDAKFEEKMILVLGGEDKGIRPNVLKRCDRLITIETEGEVESLNLSVAAGIIFYSLYLKKIHL